MKSLSHTRVYVINPPPDNVVQQCRPCAGLCVSILQCSLFGLRPTLVLPDSLCRLLPPASAPRLCSLLFFSVFAPPRQNFLLCILVCGLTVFISPGTVLAWQTFNASQFRGSGWAEIMFRSPSFFFTVQVFSLFVSARRPNNDGRS